MTRFLLISEGVTDQAVLENILAGCCGEEISVAELQPLRNQKDSFGNWLAVFDYCASPDFEQAFQFGDYIVVHIDTDRCEDPNFEVAKQEAGVALNPRQLIQRVESRLREKIGSRVWETFGKQIIFAIAVDSIECWLLPLYAQGTRATRHLNCLEPLQRDLNRQNFRINLNAKRYQDYQTISLPYLKTRTLKQRYQQNEGLCVFIENLQRCGVALFGPAKADAESEGDAQSEGETT